MEKQREIFNRKTPNERSKIAAEFIDFGHQVLVNSIRTQHLNISEAELKVEVFKRLYSTYFSQNELITIIGELENYWKKKLYHSIFTKT